MALGKMFFRTALKCFYCKIDGKLTRLSPDKEDAELLYAQLVAEHGSVAVPNVRDIVAIYLGRKQLEPTTIAKKKTILMTLVGMHGDLKAKDLEPRHVEEWVAKCYPNANPTTKRDRIAEAQAAWKYAVDHGLLAKNRIACVEKPTPSQREHFVPFAEWPRYLDACRNQRLRLLMEFMLYTGARAQETAILTVDDWQGDRFSLPKARAKGRRRGRLILVPQFLIPKIESQIAEVGTGSVFVNTRGVPYRKNSLNCAFRQLKKRLKDDKLCATSCRHSFATWKVSQGVPLEIVAKLLGHANVQMVYSRYARFAKIDILTNAVNVGI